MSRPFKVWVRVPTGVGGAMQDEKVGNVAVVVSETSRRKPYVALGPINGGPIWGARIDAQQMDALCRHWAAVRERG